MFNVGGPEVLVILVVALLVLGPAKLPEAARQVGNALAHVRRLSTGFQDEMRAAMDASDASPDKPVSPGGPTPAIDAASAEPHEGEAAEDDPDGGDAGEHA